MYYFNNHLCLLLFKEEGLQRLSFQLFVIFSKLQVLHMTGKRTTVAQLAKP
jgi:hypothetical protein